MASTVPISGPVELRIRDLVNEIFEPSDLSAAALTPILKARSAAFLVLAHAEIEYALEQECHRTAGLLRVAAEPATAMLAWGFTSLKPDGNVTKLKKKPPLEELVEIYQQIVQSNHGIRTHNLGLLLVPLGVDLNSAKMDMLALDEFGGAAGRFSPSTTFKLDDDGSTFRPCKEWGSSRSLGGSTHPLDSCRTFQNRPRTDSPITCIAWGASWSCPYIKTIGHCDRYQVEPTTGLAGAYKSEECRTYPNIPHQFILSGFEDYEYAEHIKHEPSSFQVTEKTGLNSLILLSVLLKDRYFPKMWKQMIEVTPSTEQAIVLMAGGA